MLSPCPSLSTKKHMKLTPQEELTTIDAFDPETLRQVELARAYVEENFEKMKEY